MKRVILLGVEGFGGQWPKPCRLNELEIAAIVDNCEGARARGQQALGLAPRQVFDGTDLSWADVDADCIIEATAPGGRVERVLAALHAGKDVIMAKPPVLSLEDLQRIIHAKNTLGRQVHVVTQKRYFPAFYKIKSILEREDLGRLVYADLDLRVDGTYWESGFYWRKKLPFPSLVDGSIHHFDLLRWWTGAGFQDVAAASWNPEWSPFDHDCDISAVIRMDNGALVNYTSRWSMKYGPVVNYFEGVRLEFQRGVLEVREGKLYQDGRYVPLISDGKTLMDTGELNIYILSDILKSIEHRADYYQTSIENQQGPFSCVFACVASILNEKRIALSGLETHLEEYGISKAQMDEKLRDVFVRD